MAPHAHGAGGAGAGAMESVRRLEKMLRLPQNMLLPLLLSAGLLLLFLAQSLSLSQCNQDTQVRKVTALTAALEELGAAQAEERKEALQVQQRLEQAERDKERMRQWVRSQDERAKASHGHWLALAQDMQALLGEVNRQQPPTTGAAAGTPGALSGPGNLTLTEKQLVEALEAKPGDMKKALAELEGLEAAKTGKPGAAEKVAPRLLALRALLHELRGALGKRLEAQRQQEEEGAGGGGGMDREGAERMEAQLKGLAEALKASRQGNSSLDTNSSEPGADPLASCAHTVMDLGAQVRAQRAAARRSAARLSSALQQALASPAAAKLPGALQEQLNGTLQACQLAASREEDASLCPPPSAPAPDHNETSELCPRLGCRCSATPDEIAQYLNYTERQVCPDDWLLVQHLIVERNCHSLPRRRCFSANWTGYAEPLPLPGALWNESALLDSNVRWAHQHCDSFECLKTALGAPPDCPGCFDWAAEKAKFESKLKGQVALSEALKTAANSTLRIGLDLGGGTGSFAALMAERGVTIITTGVDLDARTDIGGGGEEGPGRNATKQGVPYMETIALRGLLPLHLPHTARLPFFDATLDIIHASSSVDGMAYADFEDALYDWDRVLRPGGLLWFSLFQSQVRGMPQYMEIVERFKYNFLHRTVIPSVRPDGLHVYVNFLLQKPRERNVFAPPPPTFE